MIKKGSFKNVQSCSCFRLLNSEIGNDLQKFSKRKLKKYCFRLLNSEIGNDHLIKLTLSKLNICFRLLNSEIGNDQKER